MRCIQNRRLMEKMQACFGKWPGVGRNKFSNARNIKGIY